MTQAYDYDAPALKPKPPPRQAKPLAPGVDKLSPRHDMIMIFILANPTLSMGAIAKEFCVSAAWLSQVIHSDVFQEKLRERQDRVFHHTLLPLREKIEHLAHRTLDRLTEHVEMNSMPVEELRKTSVDTLKALGYGTSAAVIVNNEQNNTYLAAPADALAEARSRIGKRAIGPDYEPALIEQENESVRSESSQADGESATARLQTSGDSGMGEACE